MFIIKSINTARVQIDIYSAYIRIKENDRVTERGDVG